MKDKREPTKLVLHRLSTLEDLKGFLESRFFQVLIVVLIIINAITIGLETSPTVLSIFGTWLMGIDNYILGLFCIEIVLKLIVYRERFFLNAWNLFDFFIVGIALVPATGPFHILRTLRILRTIRLVKNIPKLRLIIESLILSIPSIGWIVVLLIMIFYIFAVIGVDLYGAAFPEYFGSRAMLFHFISDHDAGELVIRYRSPNDGETSFFFLVLHPIHLACHLHHFKCFHCSSCKYHE